jgi:hypothetical protein
MGKDINEDASKMQNDRLGHRGDKMMSRPEHLAYRLKAF